MKPADKRTVILARSSSVKPAFFRLVFGILKVDLFVGDIEITAENQRLVLVKTF